MAVCARVDRNGLIAAECRSLTGGTADEDGIADCDTIDLVARSAYVQKGLHVIAGAGSFDALVAAVAAKEFPADDFRIDLHDPSGRVGRSTQEGRNHTCRRDPVRPGSQTAAPPLHRCCEC